MQESKARGRGLQAGIHAARRAFGGAAFVTLAVASTALAADAEKPFAAPHAAEHVATPGAGSLVQVTLSLVFVLAAVFAAAWLLRRVKTLGKFGAGPIEIVADVSLGAKERAVLVQLGGQQLLLGVAPGRVTTLHVLEQAVGVDDGLRATGDGQKDGRAAATHIPRAAERGACESGAAQRPDFKSILKRSLGL